MKKSNKAFPISVLPDSNITFRVQFLSQKKIRRSICVLKHDIHLKSQHIRSWNVTPLTPDPKYIEYIAMRSLSGPWGAVTQASGTRRSYASKIYVKLRTSNLGNNHVSEGSQSKVYIHSETLVHPGETDTYCAWPTAGLLRRDLESKSDGGWLG
jgi:hypothetical protein